METTFSDHLAKEWDTPSAGQGRMSIKKEVCVSEAGTDVSGSRYDAKEVMGCYIR